MAGNKHAFTLIPKARLYFYFVPADEEIETHGSQGPYIRSHIYSIEKLDHETSIVLIENPYFIQNNFFMYESFQNLTLKHESDN